LSENQLSRIETRLNDASKGNRRINRKDCLILLLGVALKLATNSAAVQVMHHIIVTVLHCLISLI
jgi:hypothetical protein